MRNNLQTILFINIFLLVSCSINAQCIDEQYTTATLSSNNLGQSFTIPADGCGTLTDIVIQRRDGLSGNLNAVTATFELFLGETIMGTPLYTQNGIAISAGVGDKTIMLSGGTGSLAVNPNTQYTWYLTLSQSADWRIGQGSSGDSYSGGKGYLLNSFQVNYDIDMIINSTTPPLPVDMTFFKVERIGSAFELLWQTATELNNEGFEVQRSRDGKDWEVLDFVLGNGTKIETSDYSYTDFYPLQGKSYYRLRQIDYDGLFEYSEVVSIEQEQVKSIVSLYPNPVTDKFYLDNIVEANLIVIYNTLGQPVKQITVTENLMSISTNGLSEGIYILELQYKNGTKTTHQFIK